ncbi:MAG TPA: hypothetical protein ENO20_05975 [Bacteroides sp.]|nr:hypothetical protein [Bacteroides sp.]
MQGIKKYLWYLTIIAAAALIVITFTPLVIPFGKHTPAVFGFPRTLWTGILISVGLVVLTAIGAILHRGSNRE